MAAMVGSKAALMWQLEVQKRAVLLAKALQDMIPSC
jgi:hypothetical protein